ncbi:uncharacterized protein LOC115883355 isoform X3 [Sitophilus oryzae]|uniref:Uncharacterized protein LOC115883355 isoform X3 n=1 Tax=Sitophilus oryzae TaxID=7048 RepID=A0A6J2Y3Q9_SITOR|nr:uncharacterized protein LOC115883355 isoform X3 [Sitophilus oryzae]
MEMLNDDSFELRAEAFKIQDIVEDVSYSEIFTFLRSSIPLSEVNNRCLFALRHFLVDKDVSEQNDSEDIKYDCFLLRGLFKNVSNAEILKLLRILGPIPKRRKITAMLLFNKLSQENVLKKRKCEENGLEKTTDNNNKILKQADSNLFSTNVPLTNGELEGVQDQNMVPLKLRIKNFTDNNGNKQFLVASPTKIPNQSLKTDYQYDLLNNGLNDNRNYCENQNHPCEKIAPFNEVKSSKPSCSFTTTFPNDPGPSWFYPDPIPFTNKEKPEPLSLNHSPISNQYNDSIFLDLSHELALSSSHDRPSEPTGPLYETKNPVPSSFSGSAYKPTSPEKPSIVPISNSINEKSSVPLNSMRSNEKTSISSTNEYGDHYMARPSSVNSLDRIEPMKKTTDYINNFSFNGDSFHMADQGLTNSLNPTERINTITNYINTDSFSASSSPSVRDTESDSTDRSSEDTIVDNADNVGNDDVVIINHTDDLTTPQIPKEELVVDEKLVLKLIEMFPDASPDYIRNLCHNKNWNGMVFNEIAGAILDRGNYPKRPPREPSPVVEMDENEQLETLKALLPDADPIYLEGILYTLGGDQDALKRFIDDSLENHQYPTMKEYLRKQQISAQQKQYTTEFDVIRFMELFPDPVSVFEDPNRKSTVSTSADRFYVSWFMRKKFNQLYVRDVDHLVNQHVNKNIISVITALENRINQGCLKKSKTVTFTKMDSHNIPLLQELAYFDHKEEILQHIKKQKAEDELARQNAKELGLLQECNCCYDNEIMLKDILTCTGGCRFCRDCIKRGVEVAFGEGKIDFKCFNSECDAEFELQVLQNVLTPKIFSKIAQKKALAEIKAAGVDDLESCPFCEFATIPAPGDKLFRCLNPECMKESCRQCKEPSHVPYRCDEVEKDEGVKARTYIENKMTEALIRECYKCKKKFIKIEGCNKMTCSCGAVMCYICRQPVKSYKHFNGQGGDRHDLCPLYTENYTVNEEVVIKAALEAKNEVNQAHLINDPTADLEKHFKKKGKSPRKNHVHHGFVQPPQLPHVPNFALQFPNMNIIGIGQAQRVGAQQLAAAHRRVAAYQRQRHHHRQVNRIYVQQNPNVTDAAVPYPHNQQRN